MTVYSISLFLHIVGALGLFAVLGLEWAGVYHLQRATGAGQVREWARLLALPRIAGAASLVTLLSGIHLSATRWGAQGWIVVGLAGMVVLAIGAALGARRGRALVRALPAEDGPLPIGLRRQLQDPALSLLLRVRTALFLGVVFLMSVKPSVTGVLAAMGVALLAGVAAGLPGWSGRRAVMAGSQR